MTDHESPNKAPAHDTPLLGLPEQHQVLMSAAYEISRTLDTVQATVAEEGNRMAASLAQARDGIAAIMENLATGLRESRDAISQSLQIVEDMRDVMSRHGQITGAEPGVAPPKR